MKKNKIILLILLVFAPCILLLGGCSLIDEKVYVTDIKATDIVGATTTYTVYYSNGKTSMFTVENGADGEDGENLTIESIKSYCESNDIDFDTF